jgi:hypothetical protein
MSRRVNCSSIRRIDCAARRLDLWYAQSQTLVAGASISLSLDGNVLTLAVAGLLP